jgi:adenosine deaminase
MPGHPDDSLQPTDLARLPKIDLHRHLEGSLRLTTLRDIARQYQLDLPAHSLDALRPLVQVTDDEPTSRNFLEKFNVLRRFYQSPEIIQRLTYEVVEDAARDNVVYLELRFTPLALASSRQFPLDEVVDWVIAAVERACRDYPAIQVQLIVSLNRHEPVTLAERVTQIAVDRRARGIAGLDLAGDEVNYSAEGFRGVFRAASAAGLGLVAHAGEWTGAATIRDALEALGAQRIGHGVRVVEDPAVAALARERGAAFEVCLTSNVQSGVVPSLAAHPLRAMCALKLQVTLNTDDPAISGITLSGEYASAREALNLSDRDFKHFILTAAGHSLLPPAARAALVERFRQALALDSASPLPTSHFSPLPSDL